MLFKDKEQKTDDDTSKDTVTVEVLAQYEAIGSRLDMENYCCLCQL